MKLIPELQAFEGHIKMIKETLQITKNARNWQDLGYIHDEAKDLFNSILESKLMKEYIRQKNCHKFRDNTSKPDQIPTLSDEWLIKKFLWLKNHTQSSEEINRLIAKIRSKEDIIKNKNEIIKQQNEQIQNQREEILELRNTNSS
ncbi:unnamed protein product [Moneuplotes crassus]|uniref:Uncharacterized protein n=1 Tax=Euplotes crassus TaxID=5936 RepID=A0AAD1UAS2_EUPCR|nr:unnamed protein product [Moneuplotes crassus]